MEKQEYEALVREATRLFLTLRADPQNAAARAACKEFITRGPDHRKVFEKIERVHAAAGKKPGPSVLSIVLAVFAAGITGYFAYDPVRTFALADYRTAETTRDVALSSGDRTVLDANSALIDSSGEDIRRVELLRGAAYFDVDTSDRPFVVEVEDRAVRVLGTAFEVSRQNDTLLVAVNEGRVQVTSGAETWVLEAGDRLRVSDEATTRDRVALDTVATWREGQVIADGMTFAEMAAIIDRRLPGRVFVPNATLGKRVVSGGVSLDTPQDALRLLAAAEGARVVFTQPFGAIVLPGR